MQITTMIASNRKPQFKPQFNAVARDPTINTHNKISRKSTCVNSMLRRAKVAQLTRQDQIVIIVGSTELIIAQTSIHRLTYPRSVLIIL